MVLQWSRDFMSAEDGKEGRQSEDKQDGNVETAARAETL